MRNMWLVARREFISRGKSSGYLITTVFVAFVLLASTLAPAFMERKTESAPLSLYLLDKTGAVTAPLQAAIATANAAPGARQVSLTTVSGDEAALTERTRLENKALLIVEGAFPNGIKARFLAVSPNLLTSAGVVLQPLESIVRQARMQSRGLEPAVAQEILQPMVTETMQIATKGEGRDQNSFMGSMLVAMGIVMVLYMVVLINGQFVFQGVLEEKVSRVMEVMAATVGPGEMLAGKVIGLGALGLIQFLAMMVAWVAGTVVTNQLAEQPTQGVAAGPALLTLAFLVLGYILSATLMAAAASTISRMEDQQTVLMPITMLVALPMLFAVSVIGEPNGKFAMIMSLIPFFSQSVMVLRVMMVEVPLWQILTSLGLMVVTTVLLTWAGGRIYRAAMLSYGGRPTVKQLMAYLRG